MAARITNNLPQFVARKDVAAMRAVSEALILGSSEASVLTPIDTSTLLNSQYRDVKNVGSKVVGTVGYTAEYALAVHDPDNPQNFRRATAEKEFLSKGFARQKDRIDATLKRNLKTT